MRQICTIGGKDDRNVPLGVHGSKGSYQVLKRMMEGKQVIVHGDGTALWTMTCEDIGIIHRSRQRKMQSVEAKLRKQQSILICSGLGVILFGVWSIIRIVLMRFMDPQHFLEVFTTAELVDEVLYERVVMAVVLVIYMLDLILRSYIGLSAIREGNGKYKKRGTYICIAALASVLVISADIVDISAFFTGDTGLESFLSSVVEMTINIATIEIVVAAIKVRILRRQIADKIV